MRVSQCCCGCSLKTGTLILLWLDLLVQGSSVIKGAVAACTSERHFTFFDSAWFGWGCIVLVVSIYGLVGVDKHRPSYLLPYIGVYAFRVVATLVFTLILWVGSVAMRDDIIKMIRDQWSVSGHTTDMPTEAQMREFYNNMVSVVTVFLIICIVVAAYFLTVVYSYYKRMQEEDKGIFNPASGTGIVYAAPADQPKGYDHPPAYGQQPPAGPYPPQNAGYPQPVAGYPHLQQPAGYPQQQFPAYPQKQ